MAPLDERAGLAFGGAEEPTFRVVCYTSYGNETLIGGGGHTTFVYGGFGNDQLVESGW